MNSESNAAALSGQAAGLGPTCPWLHKNAVLLSGPTTTLKVTSQGDIALSSKILALTAFRISRETRDRDENDVLAEKALTKLLAQAHQSIASRLRIVFYFLVRSGTSKEQLHFREQAKRYSDALDLPDRDRPFSVFMRISEKLTQVRFSSQPGKTEAHLETTRRVETVHWDWSGQMHSEFTDLALSASGLTDDEYEAHWRIIEAAALRSIVKHHGLE